MRFRTTPVAAPEPMRWLVYVEMPFKAEVVEFKDYVEAVKFAQGHGRQDKAVSIEVSDCFGRIVWSHTRPV